MTIKKIAQRAGVSPTTVSNVLHGRTAKVSDETRDKIESILREANYAPNMGAMILARSNSRIVGVILFQTPRRDETVLADPFAATITGAMEHEISGGGYFMMLRTTSDQEEVVRLSRTWKLDGLILLWVPGAVCEIIKRSVDTPTVFVDCYLPDGSGYHNVGLQDRAGGLLVARHFLERGHRDLLFLANDRILPGADSARFQGCRDAFADRGLELPDDRFIVLSKDPAKREELYRELAREPLRHGALFFSADYYAAEAAAFFRESGIGVPERISIAGFDDNHLARTASPRLTTVRQDVYRKGRVAVDMLMGLIAGREPAETDVRLPVELVVRDSVGKRPATGACPDAAGTPVL